MATGSALLDMTCEWCCNINEGMVNGVIFLDLKKVFDTVVHKILVKKLRYCGAEIASINWFRSYCASREQEGYVNGVILATHFITCGVPQGSILSLLIFLIYVNKFLKVKIME